MTRAQTRDVQAVTVTVELPLPDGRIGPNGRVDRWKKAKLVREHRAWAMVAMKMQMYDHRMIGEHWPAARMDIEWRYCGNPTDSDNIVARCKAYRDGAADAGLVADDRDISIGTITTVRVKRAESSVRLTFTRNEEAQ